MDALPGFNCSWIQQPLLWWRCRKPSCWAGCKQGGVMSLVEVMVSSVLVGISSTAALGVWKPSGGVGARHRIDGAEGG